MEMPQSDQDQHPNAGPLIVAGLREWYESCPCCMSKAMPDVKQALDRERALRPAPPTIEPAPRLIDHGAPGGGHRAGGVNETS